MSCNKPLLAIPTSETTKSGKKKYLPIGRYDFELAKSYPDGIKIPCGQCAGCRAKKCREWADRMILELDHSKKALFLTLTYDDAHLPVYYNLSTGECEITLRPRDLQLFMKRLRKRFKDREIRHYSVGEYGKTTGRSHYHIILYGLGLDDFGDLQYRGCNELKQPYWSSDFLAKEVWKNGFCLLADVSWNTCAYVARYVKKKDYGLVSDEYVDRTRYPEFSLMSRNPGIGLYFPKDHPDYADFAKFHVSDGDNPIEVYFPSVFLNALESQNPAKFEELKKQRSDAARDSEMNKLYQTDLDSMELDDLAEEKIESTVPVIDFYRGL